MSISFQQAREAYASRVAIRSQHTLQAYLRSIDLLMECLADRTFVERLPLHVYPCTTMSELSLDNLSQGDDQILVHFANWLKTPGTNEKDKRPYAAATIELRLAGVQHWFEFMKVEGWLPEGFSLEKASQQVKLSLQPQHRPEKSVSIKQDLTALVAYYDAQKPPRHLQNQTERLLRWELTRLRNCALIKMLAETGGQISAILSLNAEVFDNQAQEMVLEVVGKNAHAYPIYLKASLPAVRAYLGKRAIPTEKKAETPVFVSHDAHYEGQRMSRIIAWRIIQRAARAVNLPDVSPHDLRHWCAQQWIAAGSSLEDVKMRLGHRSMHTVRVYYGHLMGE